ELGFAPSSNDLLFRYLQQLQIDPICMELAGLLKVQQSGRRRDFFSDRITFPIRDPMGAVIGFSARKYKEETFGGKYINTQETPLFKKSSTLFGLSYSRMKIAKERKVIIVEGQIDALRLIDAGFDYTVAGQGTAFGKEHVKELLKLGVAKAYLALDGDKAGQEAACKIGHLFQKEGVEVFVLNLPEGTDPDTLIRSYGASHFEKRLSDSSQYLQFLFDHLSFGKDLSSPSQKNEIVQEIAGMIRESNMPVMVHESLRKLAQIARVPEAIFDIAQLVMPDLFIKKTGRLQFHNVDANRILEADLLRWVILLGEEQPRLIDLSKANLQEHHFYLKSAWRLFQGFISSHEKGQPCDLLSLGAHLEEGEDVKLLSEILERKVNSQKAEEGLKETLRKMLIRHWMDQREEIRVQIHGKDLSDEEAVALARQFDEIKRNPPELIL
ncbi:MAG: toprim domain-containing protein, partial [Chlamydiales bacterium]|nr:toprim domain-containing protein [Chlamydiales bacterium]